MSEEKKESKKKEVAVKDKKKTKKEKKSVEKKKKEESFVHGVKVELKKTTWPSKKEVFKYCVATIVFCLIVVLFFVLLDLGLAVVKGMFQ